MAFSGKSLLTRLAVNQALHTKQILKSVHATRTVASIADKFARVSCKDVMKFGTVSVSFLPQCA